jgi:chemotaxis protein MotA
MEFDRYPRQLRPLRSDAYGPRASSLTIGFALVVAALVCGFVLSENPLRYVSLEGCIIVLGGTMASTLIQYSLGDLRGAFHALRMASTTLFATPHERMERLLEMSRQVKERGVLALEEHSESEPDDFFRLGLMLVVDGRPIDDTRRILLNEMEASRDREWRSVQVWETLGNFAPAMGLIGTLLGLIQMLGALHDPAAVGPAMSMALVATLYGSVAANLIFFPIAGKLRVVAQERESCKSVTLEGLLSLARLENPMMLEQRFQSFRNLSVQS